MFQKKLKQMGAWILALSMVLGSSQLPAMGAKAADQNLALEAEVTASSSESQNGVNNINDGNAATRWAQATTGSSAWVTYKWNNKPTIKSFSISWERRNAQAYSIQTSADGTNWSDVWSTTTAPASNTVTATLDAPVQTQYLRLNVTNILAHGEGDAEGFSWQAVSVYEFEVYGEEGEALPKSDVEQVISSITQPKISADGTHISMPDVPEGVTVRFCADYEQVIGEDGTVYTPLEEKTVKGFYEVSKGQETAKTNEFTITVPGKYTDSQEANAKPEVIPELQEWHGESGKFILRSAARIIAVEGLADTARRFAEDLKEITGKELPVINGSASDVKRGDFYLTLDTQDGGLGKEGYIMTVGDSVKIEASDDTGAYWGVVSALQILKQTGNYIVKGIARDYPKYEVRGFSIDVGRKPFTMETLKAFGKNMSWYKMNNLQVHLSDNLIFMEDYPTMEQAIAETYAGFRLESGVVNEETGKSATSEDVYYTKDEFRTFIKDSRAMGLEIVPEFDMPAHALPFTKAFQQYMSKKPGGHGYLIDEVDIANPEAIEWAKSIWADYFEGDDPVFDKETTVHIGTDEYHGKDGQEGRELFRKFSDEMINFVQGTGRTVRMWGSLSNKTGTTPVASKDVQLNIWNTGYANPRDMYNLGYDLINTLEGPNYIVPAAGYYNNYINAQSIYNSWKPNEISDLTLSAGDDQMLGACYAIWHDSIDTRANGISEYDSFDRFFQPLPAYSAKLWGEAEDRTYQQLTEVASRTGTAPGTNVYCEVETASEKVLEYTFDGTLTEDSSANSYDVTESKNVSQTAAGSGKALQLNGGESYITTPVNKVGSDASITMKVKMDADASGEQILCESKDVFGVYGTYAIKASQKNTNKVGFSREGYDYSFDYTLPKGEWVELTFQGGKDQVALFVNGTMVDDDPDIYFANHETTELSAKLAQHGIIKVATMMIPAGRIGSTTKSFKGQIDYVTVKTSVETDDSYRMVSQSEMTPSACTSNSEGTPEKAIDGDPSTIWHTRWSSDIDNITDSHPHWFQVDLARPVMIDKLTCLPRADGGNGNILKYNVIVTKPDNTTVTVVSNGIWAGNASLKQAVFDPVEAKSVKLEILDAKGNGTTKFGSIAEFNLYKTLQSSDVKNLLTPYEALKETDYTAESWAVFKEAYEDARKLAENTASTPEELQSAVDRLTFASDKLVKKEAEVSGLIAGIEEAESMNTAGCQEKYVKAYEAALAEAKEVLENEVLSQQEADEVLGRLEAARAPVVLTAATNKTIDLTGMSADTVKIYRDALEKAKALLVKENATGAEFIAALEALNQAEAGLKKEEPKPGNNDTPKPPVTGPSNQKPVPKAGAVSVTGGVQYKVTKSDAKNGTVTVSKLTDTKKAKITIPSTVTIDGYSFRVTAIAAKAFQNSKKLTSVTIGANVTNIGSKAFYKCGKLNKVIFKGSKAPKIGKQAFKGTSSKCKITVPKKMAKKQLTLLKSAMKKAGMSKKAAYRK